MSLTKRAIVLLGWLLLLFGAGCGASPANTVGDLLALAKDKPTFVFFYTDG